jgi:hypothetical protein
MSVEKQIRQYLSAIQYTAEVYPHQLEPAYHWHNDSGMLRLHAFLGDIQVSTMFTMSDWEELSKYLIFFPGPANFVRGLFKPR